MVTIPQMELKLGMSGYDSILMTQIFHVCKEKLIALGNKTASSLLKLTYFATYYEDETWRRYVLHGLTMIYMFKRAQEIFFKYCRSYGMTEGEAMVGQGTGHCNPPNGGVRTMEDKQRRACCYLIRFWQCMTVKVI